MANVCFKRGTQAALSSATASDGTFYLTTDTHRLYVAQGSEIVPVNEGVITVANVAALQNIAADLTANSGLAGSFYYATAENVLCVWNGKKWVQINPDTNTTNTGLTVSVTSAGAVDVAVADSANNSVNDGFTLAGAGTVSVSGNAANKTLTITGKQYNLISASSNDGQVVTATLYEGSGTTTPKGAFAVGAGDNVNFTMGLDNVLINATDTTLNTVSVANGSTSGFDITVTDTGNNGDTISIDPKVKIGSNETAFVQGKADLTNIVYTQAQIDNKLKDLNPMVYKGTLTTTTLPSSNIKNGDTYMVAVTGGIPVTIDGTATTAKVGDLLVATGTEGSDGYIASANLEWSLVPSGDEAAQDTTYHGAATAGGLNLIDSNQNTVGSLVINTSSSSALTVTSANTTDANNSNTITIDHATRTPSKTDGGSAAPQWSTLKTIEPITSLSFDNWGHVVSYQTRKMDIYPSKTEIASTIAASNNVGTATFTETTTYDLNGSTPVTNVSSAKTLFSLKGDNITIKTNSTDKQLELAFEWGTF